MGKAKWEELEQARRDGIGYALGIVREKGIEGLEEDVRFRNISKVSVAMSNEEYNKLVEQTTTASIDAVAILAALTLHDEFGFGEKRVKQFNERFNLKCNCIIEDFTTWEEQLDILKAECNLKLGGSVLKSDKKGI